MIMLDEGAFFLFAPIIFSFRKRRFAHPSLSRFLVLESKYMGHLGQFLGCAVCRSFTVHFYRHCGEGWGELMHSEAKNAQADAESNCLDIICR